MKNINFSFFSAPSREGASLAKIFVWLEAGNPKNAEKLCTQKMQEHSAGAGTLREVKIRADHYSADSAESTIRKEGKEKGLWGIYQKISKYEKTRGRKLHETVLFEIKDPGVDFFLRFSL